MYLSWPCLKFPFSLTLSLFRLLGRGWCCDTSHSWCPAAVAWRTRPDRPREGQQHKAGESTSKRTHKHCLRYTTPQFSKVPHSTWGLLFVTIGHASRPKHQGKCPLMAHTWSASLSEHPLCYKRRGAARVSNEYGFTEVHDIGGTFPFQPRTAVIRVPLQLVCSLVCIRGNCGKALSLRRHLFRQPLCCSFWVQFNRRELWQWFRLCCHQGFEAFLLNLFLQLDTCWTVLRTLESAGRSRQQCRAI